MFGSRWFIFQRVLLQHYTFTTGSLDGNGALGHWRFFPPIFIAPSVIKVNYFSVTEFCVEPSIRLTKLYRSSYSFFMADKCIFEDCLTLGDTPCHMLTTFRWNIFLKLNIVIENFRIKRFDTELFAPPPAHTLSLSNK